ncbi:MAG: Rpn family recombination-promoting nuclease/putative transposase [Alcaligenaceae bacterium]|nr:Rpn family recombination-promoting nuclease/putative transposase [Alcaligenaceae bacterium]
MTAAKPPPIPHDSGYKLLFSHPRMVADLLTGFIQPAWQPLVDLGTLEPYKASFVTDGLHQRHDDSIWRVRMRTDGAWLYLYLLIEFQSRDEHFMAIRIWSYRALLSQDILRAQQLVSGDKLPPILPIVLYNGSAPWTGPLDVSDLIQPVHPALAPYTPRLRYFLLQERSVPRDYSVQNPDNLVGHLIAIGQCGSVNEIRACIERLREHTRGPEDEQIQRIFAIWLSRLLRARFRNAAVPEYQNLQEVHTMLAETIDKWVQDAENRGEAKGEVKGEAALLQRQLVRKFGTIPAAAQQKIQAATPAQLGAWSLNILDATTLDEVFTD